MIVDNSQTMTGDCYNADAECPEGFEWACCEIAPEFPTTPPMMSSCQSVATGIGGYYNFSEMISMNNGQNVLLFNYDNLYGLQGYRYADSNLTKIYDRESDTFPGCGYQAYIACATKINEEEIIMILNNAQTTTNSTGFFFMRWNVVTNTQVYSFAVPPGLSSAWAYFKEPRIDQYIEDEGTIMVSVMGREEALTNSFYGLKINLANGQLVASYRKTYYQIYGGHTSCYQVGDFVYVGGAGYRPYSGADPIDNGQVFKFNKLDGGYVGVFQEGESIAGTSGRYYFGSKMMETKEHIVIYSGYDYHGAGRPLWRIAYTGYYTHMYIYDKQMNFIKKISDQSNTGGDLSYDGFGYGFSEYGNFIMIGTPSLNKVGLYDKNFNFLYLINQSSPIMPTSGYNGHPLLMSEDKMYFGQSNHGVSAAWDFKICNY